MSQAAWRVRVGRDALPFFAEYPYFVWGPVNYDSDGDCKRPTDRAWTWLHVRNRMTAGDEFDVSPLAGEHEHLLEVTGSREESCLLAARLTALRTGGVLLDAPPPDPSDVQARLALADRVRRMFVNPDLAPFDTHGWWGGWKWFGENCTEFTAGLRQLMNMVEARQADAEDIRWLREWWDTPPFDFHRDGVRHALRLLTGVDPATR